MQIILQRQLAVLAIAETDVAANTEDNEVVWGRRCNRSTNVKRCESPWVFDYLSKQPVYSERFFRGRFWVPLELFWSIHNDLVREYVETWWTRKVVRGRRGIDPMVKLMACLPLLRTADAYDPMDDSNRMGEETLRLFCETSRYTLSVSTVGGV